MFKKFIAVTLLLTLTLGAMAVESENVVVPLKGILILTPGFRATDISITDREVISAEMFGNDQIRVTGLAVGKSDLHVTAGAVAKLYTVTVTDNVREVFNSLRRDLDSVPEVEISINGNRVVLKGEVSSIEGWETLLKVLPVYGSSVVNLTIFQPAPEIMLSLKKLFSDAGVPMEQKRFLPVVRNSSGTILWIPFVKNSAFAPVTPETEQVLKLLAVHSPE